MLDFLEVIFKIPFVARAILWFFCGLARQSNPSLNYFLQQSGIVNFIYYLFHLNKGAEDVTNMACITISHLAIQSSPIRNLLKNIGVCELLIECINNVLPPHVVRNVCRGVATLSIGSDAQAESIKFAFINGRIVGRMLEISTTQNGVERKSLIRSICWAIENLITKNRNFASQGLDLSNLFNHLLALVQEFQDDSVISSHIIVTLWYLISYDEVKQRFQQEKEQVRQSILNVLKIHDTDVQIVPWGINILEKLEES